MSDRNPAIRVPEVLEAFVRKCLEKAPADRPASMEEVLRSISEIERTLFGVTSLGAGSSDLTPHVKAATRTPQASRPEAFDDTLASSPEMAGQREQSLGTASPLTSPAISTQTVSENGRGRRLAFVAVAGAVFAAAGAVAFVTATRPAPPAPSAAAAAPAVPAAANVTSFTLVLDSTPSGAEVLENDDILGTTPMQVTIARAGVRSSPRHFVLRLDGYAPYTLLQGDSESIVHVTAPLARATSQPTPLPTAALMPTPAPTSSPSQPAVRAPAQRATPRAATAAPPQQDLDIKLTR
jgi:serine/threonine-protein kinase